MNDENSRSKEEIKSKQYKKLIDAYGKEFFNPDAENEYTEKELTNKKRLVLLIASFMCLPIFIFLKISDPEFIQNYVSIFRIFGIFGLVIMLIYALPIELAYFSHKKQQKENFIMFFMGLVLFFNYLIVRYL